MSRQAQRRRAIRSCTREDSLVPERGHRFEASRLGAISLDLRSRCIHACAQMLQSGVVRPPQRRPLYTCRNLHRDRCIGEDPDKIYNSGGTFRNILRDTECVAVPRGYGLDDGELLIKPLQHYILTLQRSACCLGFSSILQYRSAGVSSMAPSARQIRPTAAY